MKTILLATIPFLTLAITGKAQWVTTSPANMYFNTGHVGTVDQI
jgi:hypothetical protein